MQGVCGGLGGGMHGELGKGKGEKEGQEGCDFDK